jgi:UDP-glucose 4-epimerase
MILVVGGLGFIGSHTTRALLDAGHPCVVTQHRPKEIAPFLRDEVGKRLSVVPIDVRDRRALLAVGDAHAITSIIDLAGAWPTTPVEELRDAASTLSNVIEAALAWKVGRVSIASTLGVYGALADDPLKEDATIGHLGNLHPIPATKKIAEIFAEQVAARAGITCVAMRIGAIFGPLNLGMRSFPAVVAHAVAKRQPVDLSRVAWGAAPDDGFDHCYVKDCGRAIALLQTAETLRHRVYNVAWGTGTRNRDFVDAVRRSFPEADLGLPKTFDDARRPEPTRSLDVSRLRGDAGYERRFDVTTALEDYVAWLRAGNAW